MKPADLAYSVQSAFYHTSQLNNAILTANAEFCGVHSFFFITLSFVTCGFCKALLLTGF